TLSGASHLFVYYFQNQTHYGINEGSFTSINYAYIGLSTAHIEFCAWDRGGL
ncbi:unnamed protein product, partial [Adineta steineri]